MTQKEQTVSTPLINFNDFHFSQSGIQFSPPNIPPSLAPSLLLRDEEDPGPFQLHHLSYSYVT